MSIDGMKRTPKMALMDLTSRPLRFGDQDQIQCVNILGMAERLIGTMGTCRECNGTTKVQEHDPGTCDKCGRKCRVCEPEMVTCEDCDEDGLAKYTRDEVYMLTAERISQMLCEVMA